MEGKASELKEMLASLERIGARMDEYFFGSDLGEMFCWAMLEWLSRFLQTIQEQVLRGACQSTAWLEGMR